MFLQPPEFIRLPKALTSEESAWENGYYQTYQVQISVVAVRLHARDAAQFGHWFAVDRYGERVGQYRKALALVNPAEAADVFITMRGGVYNVGIAASQVVQKTGGRGFATLPGGGFQFEYVRGPQPQHNEHLGRLKSRTRVPL